MLGQVLRTSCPSRARGTEEAQSSYRAACYLSCFTLFDNRLKHADNGIQDTIILSMAICAMQPNFAEINSMLLPHANMNALL